MICYRCHKEYDNSGIDKKGFKETKIQKNSSDNNYYCIDCAHENYIDEIIDNFGEPESLPEYLTGKNKCNV